MSLSRTKKSIACILLLLTACSPPIKPEKTDPIWQNHLNTLDHIRYWHLYGKINITNNKRSWHASIHWQQKGDQFDIRMIAPLGQGTLHLTGNRQEFVINDGKNSHRYQENPQTILMQQYNINLPIHNLRFWVLGQPAKGSHEYQFNDQHLLSDLTQDQWTLEYHKYHDHTPYPLPRKIFLHQNAWKIRLAIIKWKHFDNE